MIYTAGFRRTCLRLCSLIGASSLLLASCSDDSSQIGSSIFKNEVTINVDSLEYDLGAASTEVQSLDARSTNTLLGKIQLPQYGSLDCSFVSRLLPATSISIPDSISASQIDSVKMILTVPRSMVTGDPLAPQQARLYALTKALPADLKSTFNPEGYYDPSAPIATSAYTLSGMTVADSISTASTITVGMKLPKEFGPQFYNAYKQSPELFGWPQNFNARYPGIYVAPSFGNGCIAGITSARFFIYWPKTVMSTYTTDEGTKLIYKTVADSVCVLSTAPEVLSSVNINYRPSKTLTDLISAGTPVITTPGGYNVRFTFPARTVLNDYWTSEYNLGVINSLTFLIPAEAIDNEAGIGVPPSLMMVRTSELDDFFAQGKVPDNKTSFIGKYSSSQKGYVFSTLRPYIVALRQKGADAITDEDVDFTLVPVSQTSESSTMSDGSTVTTVLSCTPYIEKPTMVKLDAKKAVVVFTYSSQVVK